MPLGKLAHVGLAKEATFGTAVAATEFVRFNSEGLSEEIEQVMSNAISGIRDAPPNFEGMHTIAGPVSFDVYPNILGHFLRSALGAPVTTQPDVAGSPTVYQHVFTPLQADWSPVCAQPPYTFEIHRALEQAFQYTGCVVNDLMLSFGMDNKIMQANAAIIAKKLALIAKTTASFETTKPFLWNQAVITIGGTGNTDIQTIEFGVQNSLEGRPTLDGTREISRVWSNGNRTFPVNITFEPQDMTEYNRFRAQSEVAASIVFTGEQISGDQNFKLEIDIPKLRYNTFPINVGGAEAITAQVNGEAKYDSALAYAMRVTLTNTKQSY